MKAKLLQTIEIFPNEILAAGTEVEVLSGYCGCNDHYYVCELPNSRQVNINSEKLEITDWRPFIDWEQRRYEIAKAAMQGMMTTMPDDSFCHVQAKECVCIADELIKQLKEE